MSENKNRIAFSVVESETPDESGFRFVYLYVMQGEETPGNGFSPARTVCLKFQNDGKDIDRFYGVRFTNDLDMSEFPFALKVYKALVKANVAGFACQPREAILAIRLVLKGREVFRAETDNHYYFV